MKRDLKPIWKKRLKMLAINKLRRGNSAIAH